jgi:alginate O-acetyltransferase complex protein AlgJ
MTIGKTLAPVRSRRAFIRALAATPLALAARPALSAETRINNVLVEDDRWLLPGWETLSDPDDAGVATTLDLIAQTSRLLATKELRLLLVVIPFKARYCPVLAAGEIAPAVASRYARSLDAMRARGIATLDLDAVFRPLQTAASPLYYPTDQHWTSTAVAAAGAAIAASLQGELGVTPGDKRLPLPPLMTETRIGDLATLLPPDLQARIGPETYRQRTTNDGDLTGYDLATGALPQPGDPPRVQIAGSSFVRPMWGLPQTIAAAARTPVGLTFFNGDAGPYHTLLMNLRSTLPKRRPQAIVWQVTEANLHLGPAATGWWSMADLMSADFFLSHVRETVATV